MTKVSKKTQPKQSCKTGVMPRFFCKKCNTHIGCSYENFGNMCDEEINFEANLEFLIIEEEKERIKNKKK